MIVSIFSISSQLRSGAEVKKLFSEATQSQHIGGQAPHQEVPIFDWSVKDKRGLSLT